MSNYSHELVEMLRDGGTGEIHTPSPALQTRHISFTQLHSEAVPSVQNALPQVSVEQTAKTQDNKPTPDAALPPSAIPATSTDTNPLPTPVQVPGPTSVSEQPAQPQATTNVPQPMSAPSDPLAQAKSIAQQNNVFSSLVESQERLQKNQQKVIDNNNIYNIRETLRHLPITPLPKTLEVSTQLPLRALPKEVQELICAVAAGIGVPIEMAFVAWLGAIFIAARGNFRIKITSEWLEVLTGYVLCSAASGQRKSAVVDLFRSVFVEIQVELQHEYGRNKSQKGRRILLRAMNMVEAALANKLCDGMLKHGLPMKELQRELANEFESIENSRVALDNDTHTPRLLVDAPTPEKLAVELGRQNEAIGMFEPEGGFWKSRVHAALDDILLKGYTGESYGADTKTMGAVYLQAPVLSICTFVQPNVLEGLYSNSDLTEHGLISRILPVLAPSYNGANNGADIPTALIERYEQKIRSLLSIRRPDGDDEERTFHMIELSAEAKDRIAKYGHQIRQQSNAGAFDAFPAFGSKLAGHAVRLAGAVHLVTHTDPQNHEIADKTMEAGIAFAEFFRIHAEAAHTQEARDGVKYGWKIYNWMKRRNCKDFTERDAQRGIGHCKISEIQAGIDMLERHNYLHRYVNGNSTTCVVHPYARQIS